MVKVECYNGPKRIPFLLEDFFVTYEGKLTDAKGEELSLEEFNVRTKLNVRDKDVLTAVTFQKFNWPPTYWTHLRVLKTIDGVVAPENVVLGMAQPVPSKEFPGFFMIPYYSDYVIAANGVLIKRSNGREVTASQGPLGYYTYRMTDDSGSTQNRLRHRILCYAFKPYPAQVEDLDVNHKNGQPGSDSLENLEWCSRSENNIHAVGHGLRNDNVEVAARDMETGKVFIFASYSQAGRHFGVTETTISNRAKTEGYKSFNGFQFRRYPHNDPWPEFESEDGNFLVTFPDGREKRCGCVEAAKLAGLTRTSLLRAIREGRCYGKTQNRFQKL